MFRGNTRALLLGAEIASAELRKLLPLLPLKSHGSTSSSFSVAALITSTAFANTMNHSSVSHSRDCPVLAQALPLSRIGSEPSFTSRPCVNCVRKRVHYLASVVFCDDFEQRCSAGDARHQSVSRKEANKVTTTTPRVLERGVAASFGSLSALQQSVQQLSNAAMSPGRLWIVYGSSTVAQSGGNIDVLSLPGCKVPLAHGLWPLAVVNLSEERLCDELERHVKSGGDRIAVDAEAQPPAWSHAARTPGAAAAMSVDVGRGVHDGAFEHINLSDLLAAIARRALDNMNWGFVEEQLASAQAYYNSAERANTRQEHRKGKEQLAAMRAMSRLKDSGAVIHAADSVTISSSHPVGPAAETAKESVLLSTTAQAASTTAAVNAETSMSAAQDASGAAGAASSAAASAVEGESAGEKSSSGGEFSSDAAAAEPRPVLKPDGTWEYHYDNGDVTKVRKDGTKIFQTKGLTTTVYGNGDTLFEYPNSTSIMDRADGVRITKYADGTTREERLK
ncbi:putative mitochondrial hypothetical protein [Leptomonas pyrrhocoris]|uniref:Centromere protein J C-terminal domain-containing protein n=1 Tax=Leptomonas pyrrhocoris TaxID=157538 RepID=A0A0N0DWR2_LEPPY|nr:putative mitochondrial hypothetical protein [Leptomonas pyrrhocoris]XP_015660531.1 putative mitochondrial hypothetical protein [Leptomonas pyrrhocoris]KPA82091.1 putative mitochondrial hypothetical protein [Leptomonas pyrrhocoris]KPA82092.1 putative mitochondrial hypothetical protein [Leptomonas pyrrhocoris]|eukprot:XP_015660530.1 putative mitochondrial hypothetical protein [Leptomonas pyrrhocoris]